MPLVAARHAREDREERRLAGPFGPSSATASPGRQVDVDPVQGPDAPVAARQRAGDEHRVAAGLIAAILVALRPRAPASSGTRLRYAGAHAPPHQGAARRRRSTRRRPALRRDRRALISAAIPVVRVAVLALVLGVMGGGASDAAGPLASPVPSPELGSGARPPELVIARAEGVQVHIPVDPERVTAMAFHPIDDASGVELEATGGVRIHQAPREGRTGPATAGLDVGAPAGTTVYAPVDGVIASVSDYTCSARSRVRGHDHALHRGERPGAPRHPPRRAARRRRVRAWARRCGRGSRSSAASATSPGWPSRRSRSFTADAGNHVHCRWSARGRR